MKATDHYRDAERQIDLAYETSNVEREALHLATAQVHATLALAGATALQSYARVDDSDDELGEWESVAGGDET